MVMVVEEGAMVEAVRLGLFAADGEADSDMFGGV